MEPSHLQDRPAQTTLVRHIVPVVLGTFVAFVLTGVTAAWLAARGVLPPLALDTALRGIFCIAGAHLAARLAPAGSPRMRYALAVGIVLTVLNVLAASSRWGMTPSWYLLAGIALPFPCAIVGGAAAARAANRLTAAAREREAGR